MRKEELTVCLRREVDKWSSKPFEKLKQELAEPQAYEIDCDGQRLTVELQVLERVDDYVHVGVDIDDGTPLRTIVPVATSFIVFRDGRVEKE